MITLVTGGSGSGKSAYAEEVLTGFGDFPRIYIATMYPFDEESKKRIERHRKMRAEKNFNTIECYTGLRNLELPEGCCPKYKLVLRKDMRKGAEADAKLYYANAKAAGTVGIQELCDLIAEGSTASAGDVKLILDELIRVMRRSLGKGEVVQVGELGNFQLQFGSTGTLTEKEFNSALIKSKRILFRPGKQLRDAISNYTFEKIVPETPSTPSGGGEEERPGEL